MRINASQAELQPNSNSNFSSKSSAAQDPEQRQFMRASASVRRRLYKTLLLNYYDVSFQSALSPNPSTD
jgi:hypothetical protein